MHKRCQKDGIDLSSLAARGLRTGQRNSLVGRDIYDLGDVMVENSTYPRSSLRRRLLRSGVIPYVCAVCGRGPEWEGRPLTLILDHINGVNNDHRKENLRFLCPNCSSQTDTFSGRNRGTNGYR